MSRLLYNQAIIDKLQELINKHPYLRFGQLITDAGIIHGAHMESEDGRMVVTDPFYEESEITWKRMCKNRFCFNN